MKQNNPSFGNGIHCYTEALGFMFKHNLWHYFFYPLILNIGLFFVGFQLIDLLSDNLNDWIAGYFGTNGENLSWFKSALNSLLYWAIWITTKIIFFIVNFQKFHFLLEILMNQSYLFDHLFSCFDLFCTEVTI